ncbi:MAG: Flavin reductase-like, FMN-binding protein [Rhodocyclaceae bacterium]|nr:Flavin reductase-like, FMN-binding protein [Rhodocyclaceae bacterium]
MSQSSPDCMAPPTAVQCTSSDPSIPLDCRALRNTLGRFATGVAVVTAVDPDGHPVGLTVNSFAAVSLNPPLVLWSLANASGHLEAFRRASHHCINILAADQEDISNRFATWPVDRFAGLAWHPGLGGAPRLDGCCAHFEVRNDIQHPGGDHLIFILRVEGFDEAPERAPLVFHGGRYRHLADL